MQRKAFTLIELLVVIAIIAILAPILFPVFAQAKLAAKKTQDLSNLKNLGTGSLIYSGDTDDYFPRNDYRLPTRQTYFPITYREIIGPYVKNGISKYTYVTTDGTSAELADKDIWNSPTAPPGRYGYGANGAIFPSGQVWNIDNGGNVVYNDQMADGTATGKAAAPSVSQTQLPRVANTLMLTTLGISSQYGTPGSANVYMQSGLYWWQGASANIVGATIPKKWDADANDDYSGDITKSGPSSALPRFRYNDSANVVWADGHAKSKKKGGMSWCTDMYVPGANVDPYSGSTTYDDGYAFGAGQVCAGYAQQ
ncbi:prepilin-type N-terminal cleavage/methylation domain-containing protein [bacterium]|nr:MAG: prepilin-type N-terminal cleavage/methylation domain-containing protein [bacterium]